jgi:predicted nucleic acid-binding protein
MAKIKAAVIDAGPFIHLHEIGRLSLLGLFESVLVTFDIVEECEKKGVAVKAIPAVSVVMLKGKNKDFAKYLVEKYELHVGESTGISLCRQEHVSLFITDDLDARDAAKALGFEAHGTLSIVLRALRENLCTPSQAIDAVERLYADSTLFITKELKEFVCGEIRAYAQKG